MKEGQNIDISQMNPFLVPKKEFEDAISKEVLDSNKIVYIDWIHLHKSDLNDIEIGLLTKEAQDCVEDYTLDGYWCCLYIDDNSKYLPEWWDSVYVMVSDKNKGTSIVYYDPSSDSSESNWLDSLFKQRYTKYAEELNVSIVVDIEKLKEEVHRFPIITLRTPKHIVKDLYGVSEEGITDNECNYIKGYLEDNSLSFHNYLCVDVPTLQDIILHDCENHDVYTPYTYTYKSHDLYIIASVVYEKKSKATITFTTKDNIVDRKYYIVWSSNFTEEMLDCIESINNNTKYFPKELS